jgi:CBS domain-containing protein
MQLKGIMAKNVLTITSEETIAGAARRMQEANVGCLVITNSGKVQGIITDRDLAVRCISQGHNPQQCHVSNHMSSPVITTEPDMDILDAAHLMTEQKVKRLPVVEGDQLIGLVSFSDVAQAMDRPMHDLMVGMGAARRIA